eukprot:c11749_g1_i7.p1 GENE.c11749_g1_i7~~c11749_g1_i7.p1  ORF type:complete len:231 (+),score=45.03 c11749_g1_i7:30-695(+)
MRRRGGAAAGIRGIRRNEDITKAVSEMGDQLAEVQMSHLQEQLGHFRLHLEEFAKKHRAEIKKNPVFRMRFQQMCSKIGVDPLASNKGFWSEILGVGDFYFELGVQILHIALATRPQNGGLVALNELLAQLTKHRGKFAQPINLDDVERAVQKIGVLGGVSIVTLADGSRIFRSVPCELTEDHSTILNFASKVFQQISISSLSQITTTKPPCAAIQWKYHI